MSSSRRDGFAPISQDEFRIQPGPRRTEATFAGLLMGVGLLVLILGFGAGFGPSSSASSGVGPVVSATPSPTAAVTPTPTYVPAGYTWLNRTTPTTNSNFFGITYGNGKFVAVAAGGCQTNCAMTSADGATWTLQTNPLIPTQAGNTVAGAFNDVAYGGLTGNEVFVAVGSGGMTRIMNSTDGVTWKLSDAISNTQNWLGITYDGPTGNKQFVAVSASGNTGAAVSADGVTWTTYSTPNSAWTTLGNQSSRWFDVAWGGIAGQEVYAAVSFVCWTDCVMTSSTGNSWALQTNPASGNNWVAITFGGPSTGRLFVALAYTCPGGQCVMTSPDGSTWTLRSTPASYTWNDVAYGGSPGYEVFLAVADGPSSASSLFMTSRDGITWTLGSSSPNAQWHAVAVGQMLNGNALFASVAGGCGNSCVMTSA